MRVVVDVMGGDHGCGVVVKGAVDALAANSRIARLYLVGDQQAIQSALVDGPNRDARIEVVHATEVLSMQDKPVVALRKKKDCSILRAVELLKEGQAEVLVSPGNTGGVVAASTIRLRSLPGVDRPAIATVMPAPERDFVLLDAGANIECRPLHLVQYAIMGSVYAREVLHYSKPRVGLLNVGTEEVKGNDLTIEAFKLCKRVDLNFIGNVEGYDLFSNRVDVVVCDGFVGNIVLKTCENLAMEIFAWLKRELTKNALRSFGAWLAKDAFRTIKQRVDSDAYGGAPLLGLNGNIMIAHGSARERAIANAIRITTDALQNHLNQTIVREIEAANAVLGKPTQPASSLP